MEDGLCYIRYNSDTFYAFPDLSCTEGSILPTFTTTTRQVYRLFNDRLELSQVSSIDSSFNNYSSYITHISSGLDGPIISPNSLVLPAALFVLAFFSVIYHWFIRLRG